MHAVLIIINQTHKQKGNKFECLPAWRVGLAVQNIQQPIKMQ